MPSKEYKMSAAEFKSIRESLGLNSNWLAAKTEVKIRDIKEWEEGKKLISQSIAKYLLDLENRFENVIDTNISQYLKIHSEQAFRKLILLRYRTDIDLWSFHPELQMFPTTTHALILMRTRSHLLKSGVVSIIQYMNPSAYFNWLGVRTDTEQQRIAWANSQESTLIQKA